MAITIELPTLENQTAFNLARWEELLADSELAKIPNRIETDRYGHILMSPLPARRHSRRRGEIIRLLHSLAPHGETLPECPISTADGVKGADVAWLSSDHPEFASDQPLFTRAPEICIEILSPSNFAAEMAEKRALYFDAGAREVWMCNLDGTITFFVDPNTANLWSLICPAFPKQIG